MGACCLCACVFKIALVILNTAILLAGLAIAGLGGVLLGIASNMMIPLLLQGIIYTFLNTVNVVDQTTLNNIEQTNLTELLVPAGTALVIVGGVIAIVGAVGYLGMSINIILKIYTIVLSVLILIETIGVALFFSGTFNDQLRTGANITLVKNYVDIYDANIYSMLWNVVMIEVDCCGLDGYEDFHYTDHPYPMNDTIKVNGGKTSIPVTLQTPLACCQTNGTYPSFRFVDDYCAVQPNDNTSNWNTGCWNKVYKILSQPPVIVICSLIIIAQSAIAAMAGIILKENSGSVSPV